MPTFRYQATGRDGQALQGMHVADTLEAARRQLEATGLTIAVSNKPLPNPRVGNPPRRQRSHKPTSSVTTRSPSASVRRA